MIPMRIMQIDIGFQTSGNNAALTIKTAARNSSSKNICHMKRDLPHTNKAGTYGLHSAKT